MTKKTTTKGIIKDIAIVGVGVLVIWIGLQLVFGTQNPFYVVSSGSMIPVLEVYDVLVVSGHEPFENVQVGDIIVFNRPSDHDRVIVHRVASITQDDPKTIRTKGDANPASIPGTDFPITEEEYIGKVAYVIPQIGYITQVLRPPINYIIIVIVIGVMVAKQISKNKRKKQLSLAEQLDPEKNQEGNNVEFKMDDDSQYSKTFDQDISSKPDVESSEDSKIENKKDS